MTNTLAIIAAGAMGSAIARRMAKNGARVLTSLKGRSQATVDRAHQAGMISASDEEIVATACSQSFPPRIAPRRARPHPTPFRSPRVGQPRN
jgi:3-hydroxyacyl-CoA dehydrogenase